MLVFLLDAEKRAIELVLEKEETGRVNPLYGSGSNNDVGVAAVRALPVQLASCRADFVTEDLLNFTLTIFFSQIL